MEAPEEEILRYLEKQIIHGDNPYTEPVLKEAVKDSYSRLIAPAIERKSAMNLRKRRRTGPLLCSGKI